MHYIIIILLIVYRFIIKTVSSSLSFFENGRLAYDIDDPKMEKKLEDYKAKSNLYISAASLMSVIILLFSGMMAYSKLVILFALNRGVFYTPEGLTVWGYLAFIVVILVLAFVFTLLGGTIPRNIAAKNPVWYIVTFGIILKLTAFVLFPLVKLISAFSLKVSKYDFDPDDFEIEEDTQDEIQQLLTTGEETGTIDEDEREMIENVFALDDTTAEDIFTHRKNLVALPSDCTLDDIKKVVLYKKYTRIPVYEGTIDNIIGILNTKDFSRYYIRRTSRSRFNIKRLLKPTFYVPTNKKVAEIFEEMQKSKIHLAIVVDEYGGTLGIVTMEDIVEEIMGEILDEYDVDETPAILKEDDNTFIIDGKALLEDVADELETEEFDEDDIDTMGGYVIAKMGHIPEDKTESFSFEFDGWCFETQKIEDKRIVSVKATKILSRSDNRTPNTGEESPGSAEQNAG